jgi:hypothetical protein
LIFFQITGRFPSWLEDLSPKDGCTEQR